jgi:hypothetical protein
VPTGGQGTGALKNPQKSPRTSHGQIFNFDPNRIIFIYIENRQHKKIISQVGTNLTLLCDFSSVEPNVKIEKLAWKLSHTIIAKFVNGKPIAHQNNRVSFKSFHLPFNFFLLINILF